METARLPNGQKVELEIIRHPGAAAVVPLHADGSVTLVYQYRHAGGGMHHEVPAGVLETDETPLQCARRELSEEVQLLAEEMKAIGCIYTTPGFTDERIHLFLAERLSPSDGTPEEDEYIEIIRIPMPRALAKVRDGTITDGIVAQVMATGPGVSSICEHNPEDVLLYILES